MERLHFGLKFILAFLIMSMLSIGMVFQINTVNYANAEESVEVQEAEKKSGGELRPTQA